MSATETEVARYRYEDEDSVLLYETIRYATLDEDGKLGKTFRQRAANGTWSMKDVRRVPYRLPALLTAKAKGWPIVVAEGEKDVDRLAELGIVATTNAGGSSWAWTHEFAESFVDAQRVVVVVDSDAPGRKAGNARCAMLAKIVKDVRLLDLAPDRTDGYDVSDYLEEHTKGELRDRLTNAPAYVLDRDYEPKSAGAVLTFDDLIRRSSEHVDWMIEGVLRRSGILLMASRPKVGKSDTARNLAKAIATGTPFLGRRCQQGKVLWIGLEEPIQHLVDRLEVMGMRELDIAYVVEQPQGDESAWLRSQVEQHKPELVIIDTIGRFSKIENVNDYSQVVRATQPMLDLRSRLGTTFVLLHHNNAANTTLGSTMWEGFCDSIMSLSRNNDGTRFVQTKQRSGTEMEATALTMDPDTGVIDCKESAFIANQRVAEKRILEFLGTGASATREDLANRSGQKAYIGRSAVDSLLAAGLITATGTGVRGEKRLFSARGVSPKLPAIASGYISVPILAEVPGDPEETSRGNPDEIPRFPNNPEDSEESEDSEEMGSGETCGFPRGAAGENCARCGQSIADHYAAAR